MRSWNRSPRLTRRALREGGGLDLDVLHCRGPTTSWCARVRQRLTRPVETSLECRSHSSTPNTTPVPCWGKVDSHILMVLVCALAWQETWIFSGSFLNIAFIDKLRNNCSNSLAKWWSGRRAGGEIPAHIPEVIQKPFQCSILQLQKKWFWQYALCMALGL